MAHTRNILPSNVLLTLSQNGWFMDTGHELLLNNMGDIAQIPNAGLYIWHLNVTLTVSQNGWFLTSAHHGGSVRLTSEPSFGQTETERQTYGRWRIKKRDRPVNWDMHWFLSMPCYSVCHMWWALLYLALWQTIRSFEIFRLCRQINANSHITTINAFISKKSSD